MRIPREPEMRCVGRKRLRAPLIAFGLLGLFLTASAARADNYALLVGINNYPRVRQLKGAVNDIVQIRRVVIEDLKFPQSNVKVLLNEEATKANILAALDGLVKQTKAGDTVLWYYSGHGWVQRDEDGDEALLDPDDKLDEVIVPYDATPWPRERALDPNPTMVVDDEIGARLSRLLGRRLIVVFDSCHSGTATRGLPGEDQTRALYENYPLPATPRTRSLRTNQETLDVEGETVFMSAASAVQAASDLGDFEGTRHGAFTAGLLRTIQQLGPGWQQNVTLEQLFRATRDDMLNHGFASQTPSISARDGLSKVPLAQLLHPPAAAELAQLQTAAAFDVQLAANKYQFEEGDLLELMVESDRDGYLYLFDINADQAVTQLVPNRFGSDNRLRANVSRKVPAAEERFQLRAGAPFGLGRVVAIVTTAPWAEADKLQLPLGLQPINDAQKSGLRDSLRVLQDSVSVRSAAGAKVSGPSWASRKITVDILPKGSLVAATQAPPEIATPGPPAVAAAASAAPSPAPAAAQVPAAAATATTVSATAAATAGTVVAAAAAPAVAAATAPATGAVTGAATAAAAGAATGAAAVSAPASPSTPPAAGLRVVIDDANLTREQQLNLPRTNPDLFAKLQRLAERFSPIFWQDVSGEFDTQFQPWRDFFVRYDFDQTQQGPNWPPPPSFQDENKRTRNQSMSGLLTPDPSREVAEIKDSGGIYRVTDKRTAESYQLDLRPAVYWAVLTTPTHYFFNYVAFHGQDWKPMFGHTGDLEGTTIVVDRQTEKMVAAFTLAHDDVGVVRGLDDEPEGNIGVLVNPNAEARGLFDGDDGRPVDGSLAMEAGRDGEPAPKEHQEIYVESRGHGQYGPHKIKPSRYIIYGSFFGDETYRAPSFDRQKYPVADKFADVPAKHKYQLVYIGGGANGEKSLWSEYKTLGRFGAGVNPPWDWRDNLFFKTGWWKDPRKIKKIGAEDYRLNPYLLEGK